MESHARVSFKEYVLYDALRLAQLVRRGEVTPDELLDAALAHGGGQSASQRRDPPDGDAGARRDHGRAAGRTVSRRAVPDQGPDHGLRRRTDARRLASAARLHPPGTRNWSPVTRPRAW